MSDVIELLKSELGTQKLKDTGIGGGGCISSGSTYETDHGRVFIKVNTKSKVSLSFFFFFFFAGLGGSVGCAVRLETRRSRVQPPPRSATFFCGD